jgi:L-alanine-DL-glutamate epimerase-like enolase superfamily enzyme
MLRRGWRQNGGVGVFAAISAIDMVLWDIRGKFFDAPGPTLLGGKRRETLRSYASQHGGWAYGGSGARSGQEPCPVSVVKTPMAPAKAMTAAVAHPMVAAALPLA